jgi:hypothetical protein
MSDFLDASNFGVGVGAYGPVLRIAVFVNDAGAGRASVVCPCDDRSRVDASNKASGSGATFD